jgi:uncharacterized membrane protein YkoI
MKRKQWLWGIASICFISLVIMVMFQLIKPASTEQAVTEQEAVNMVKARYSGTIKKLNHEKGRYIIQLERDTGLYELIIDEKTGDVSSLMKLESYTEQGRNTVAQDNLLNEQEVKEIVLNKLGKNVDRVDKQFEGETPVYRIFVKESTSETIIVIDASSGAILSNETKQTPLVTTKLTEEEAKNIALQQVSGTVDEIDTENVNNVPFYYIEVELENGNEATVEINAITGEVKSLTWDDQQEDE